MKIYKVTYWDPCSGMNGQAVERGHYATQDLAEAYIKPRAVGWDHDAYRIREIDVIESLDPQP